MTKITELRNAFIQIVPQIQADQVEYYTNILNRLHALADRWALLDRRRQ